MTADMFYSRKIALFWRNQDYNLVKKNRYKLGNLLQKPISVDTDYQVSLCQPKVLRIKLSTHSFPALTSLFPWGSTEQESQHASASVFSLSVMDVGGRRRQEFRAPKRHSYNNIRPFWLNAILELWETLNTAAWNLLNNNFKWQSNVGWRLSTDKRFIKRFPSQREWFTDWDIHLLIIDINVQHAECCLSLAWTLDTGWKQLVWNTFISV